MVYNNQKEVATMSQMIIEILKCITLAQDLGMLPQYNAQEGVVTTTSSSFLLYNGRPPRDDVAKKLERIVILLKGQTNLYPHFTKKNLSVLIGKALGYVDARTMENYLDCITSYSSRDIENGTFDVTGFCAKF